MLHQIVTKNKKKCISL